MATIKWTGKESTLIRKEFGGEAFPVKSGGTIEVDERTHEELVRLYPDRIETVKESAKETVKKNTIKKAVVDTKKIAKN